MIVNVSSSSALTSAVRNATDGDVIQLSSGSYNIDIRNASFANGVTITSAPGAKVEVTGLLALNDKGLTFKDLEFVRAGSQTFQVMNSSNITLDQLYVHGSLDGDATNDDAGIMVRDSTNVVVQNSEFQQLYCGLSHLDNDGMVVRGNYFHEIAMDGVRGGGSSNVIIDQNFFTDFQREGSVHPDAIQFWTSNETTSAHDITITNNVISRGDGTAMQGIFIRDEVGNIPFEDVTVSGNLVLGSMWHGIAIDGGKNVNFSDNTVVAAEDPSMSAWIRLLKVSGGTVANNVATRYTYESETTTKAGNETVAASTDGGLSVLNSWLHAHPGLTALPQAPWDEVRPTTGLILSGTAAGDALTSIGYADQFMDGGAGSDTLTGGYGDNILAGGLGDDLYVLNYSDDAVIEDFGAGIDTVKTGAVTYTLADNVEKLVIIGSGGKVANGNELSNDMQGNALSNTFRGYAGDDTLAGRDGSDYLYGGAGNDSIHGGNQNDKMEGGDGNDYIVTGGGDDKAWGDAGNDTLVADSGNDSLAGGAGADVFIFQKAGTQRVEDFNRAEGDWISLRVIDADVNTANNQNFKFIGTGGFTKHAGELRYVASSTYVTVMGDTNGDGVADLKMIVYGTTSVTSGDFML